MFNEKMLNEEIINRYKNIRINRNINEEIINEEINKINIWYLR